jgi:hypothetical protein
VILLSGNSRESFAGFVGLECMGLDSWTGLDRYQASGMGMHQESTQWLIPKSIDETDDAF